MKNSDLKDLSIIPLVGIDILTFGMNKKSVYDLLGQPEEIWNDTDFFWNSNLKISYNNDEIDFISINKDGRLKHRILLFGYDFFETSTEQMLEIIVEKTKINWQEDYKEIPYAYKFPELSLYLWREYLPDSFEEDDDKEYYSKFEYIEMSRQELE